MREKLIALLKLAGVSEEKINELKARLDEFKEPEPPKTTQAETNQEVLALREEVRQLTALITKANEAQEKGVKAQEDRLKAEKAEKVKALIEKAKKEGKIAEASVAHITTLAEADYEATVKVIDAMPVLPGFKTEEGKKTGKEQGTQAENKAPERSQLLSDAREAFAESMKK